MLEIAQRNGSFPSSPTSDASTQTEDSQSDDILSRGDDTSPEQSSPNHIISKNLLKF